MGHTKKKITGLSLAVVALHFGMAGLPSAQEMDHSQHHEHQHSGHDMDMSMHQMHDTGASAHIHHGHGKGMWMFEYRFMRMSMDGLLDGTDEVNTQDISGVLMADPSMPATSLGKEYRMAPTSMTMDMHMLMVMYGLTDKLSLMGMVNYLNNDMDMVMHMFMPNGDLMMTMEGSMETSGLGDTIIGGMYSINKEWMASAGLSIPTGAVDEQTTMVMRNPVTGAENPPIEMRAPYAMQLGSGTYDLIPSVTYRGSTDKIGYGAQASYTLRLGENDEKYTLGNRFELTGWGKYVVNNNFLVSGRLAILNWDKIDGQDPKIMPKMNVTNDPNNYGGTRADLLVGANGFFDKGHMVGAEFGVPVYQDLNGPQMKTEWIFSLGYQYILM
jgi:hypothetical protein